MPFGNSESGRKNFGGVINHDGTQSQRVETS